MGHARLTELVHPVDVAADAATSSLTGYPYLVLSLILLAIFTVVFRRTRHDRVLLVFGGLGSAAFSFSSFAFVPDYWDPVRIWSMVVGPEDLVFSFANGGIAWWLATRRCRALPDFNRSGSSFVARFLGWTLLGIASGFPAHMAGFPPMTCCFFSMIVVGAVLLVSRPDLRKAAFAGAVEFGALYTVLGVACMAAFPDFTNQWTHENLCGIGVWGLPIEETLWAIGFGAVFPLIVASSARVRFCSGHS